MAVSLPESARDVIDGTNFATLATVNADGSPHTAVVWVGPNEDELLFSTTVGRRTERNMRRGGSRKALVSSRRCSPRHLPVRRKNGTPVQRQFSTRSWTAAKDGVRDFGSTPFSLR